jgi:hypothetical protein
MITKEEYKKTVIRMWDSVRTEYKGFSECAGVTCRDCPIASLCGKVINYYDVIEFVEEWGKEHPLKTNREEFTEILREKFGDTFNIPNLMRRLENTCQIYTEKCDGECSECGQKEFWDKEYKEVNKDASSN